MFIFQAEDGIRDLVRSRELGDVYKRRGRDVWKRDFTGSTSVFSIWFKDDVSPTQVEAVIDSLELFQIGLSWGGVNSLAIVYPDVERPGQDYAGRLVRLNIGLEHTDDLIRDLKNALQTHF